MKAVTDRSAGTGHRSRRQTELPLTKSHLEAMHSRLGRGSPASVNSRTKKSAFPELGARLLRDCCNWCQQCRTPGSKVSHIPRRNNARSLFAVECEVERRDVEASRASISAWQSRPAYWLEEPHDAAGRAGAPPGCGSNHRRFLDLAAAGNSRCLQLCLDRLLPKRHGRPIELALPPAKDIDDVVAAIAAIHLSCERRPHHR